jgi:hypothetical protein
MSSLVPVIKVGKAASEASCGVRRTRKRNSKLCLLFQVGRFVLVVKLWWHIIKSIDYGFHYWHIYNDNEIKKKDSLCWLSLDVWILHLCTFHKVMKVIVSRTVFVKFTNQLFVLEMCPASPAGFSIFRCSLSNKWLISSSR